MKDKLTQSSVKLGDYIRKMRLKKEYSQYYMAHLLKVSQNSYCLLENGQIKFSWDRIIQIAAVFELSTREFLEGYFNGNDR